MIGFDISGMLGCMIGLLRYLWIRSWSPWCESLQTRETPSPSKWNLACSAHALATKFTIAYPHTFPFLKSMGKYTKSYNPFEPAASSISNKEARVTSFGSLRKINVVRSQGSHLTFACWGFSTVCDFPF